TPKAPWERGPMSEMLAQPASMQQVVPTLVAPVPTLELKSVSVRSHRRGMAVRDLSLNVLPGEVLGVAGVDGSGQKELAEAIVGLRPLVNGSIWLDGGDITHHAIAARMKKGL